MEQVAEHRYESYEVTAARNVAAVAQAERDPEIRQELRRIACELLVKRKAP